MGTPAPGSPEVLFSRGDTDLIMAAGCSLDASPKSNWVQEAGGLPEYICRIARAVRKTGKTTSQAIAIAVSRTKKWAAGGDDVNADTRAKAAKAVAQWEALKAKSNAKRTELAAARGTGVLCLAALDYNTDTVRSAFDTRQREARRAYREAHKGEYYDDDSTAPGHLWIKEMWSRYLIVSSNWGSDATTYRITYEVADDGTVAFGEPVEVRTEYVVVDTGDMTGADLTDADLQKLLDLTADPLERILALATPSPAALHRITATAKARTAAKPVPQRTD